MTIFRDSPIWTMSSDALKTHLNTLDFPDRIYWDARTLKKENTKFQNLSWGCFRRPEKVEGVWQFAPEAIEVPALAPAPTPTLNIVSTPAAPTVKKVTPPAPTIDELVVVAALKNIPGAELSEWILADCPHPAPAAIMGAKQSLGCGWKQIQTVARSLS